MWHASVAYHGRLAVPEGEFVDRAMRVLRGVGDASAGEWIEVTSRAVHVRRRLSADEVEMSGLTPRDIRFTDEAVARFDALPAQVRRVVAPLAVGEVWPDAESE